MGVGRGGGEEDAVLIELEVAFGAVLGVGDFEDDGVGLVGAVQRVLGEREGVFVGEVVLGLDLLGEERGAAVDGGDVFESLEGLVGLICLLCLVLGGFVFARRLL